MIPECERMSSITNVINYKPWQGILTNIIKQLLVQKQQAQANSNTHTQNLEIELKYCYFQPQYHQSMRYNLTKQLSNQSAIHYYGQRTGFVAGYFDQKRFYGMQEFLLNICKCNEERLPSNNFYTLLKKNYSNYKYKFTGKELRIDFNKDDTRHTYTIGKGWSKMKKSRANDPLDMIFCQSEFRFTFNKEQECEFSVQDLRKTMNETKQPWIRIKNIMKFEKNDEIEIALSEVLEIDFKKTQFRQMVLNILDEPEELQNLIKGYFVNFYNQSITPRNDSSAQFQIESEVLQEKLDSLVKQLSYNQDIIVQSFFQKMLQDFESLKWADYSIMWEETKAITDLYNSKNTTELPETNLRFQTVKGDYMRNQVRKFINADKP